jgi:hypothetical protein
LSDFVTELEKQILALRAEGMSFKAIAKKIPCSLSTVNYFLTEGAKEKTVARTRNRRRRLSLQIKAVYGAKCIVCGYDKCNQALEFDHIDPKTKKSGVSAIRDFLKPALEEAAKCLLLCCRCHRERHAGLLDIGAYMEPTI